MNLYMILAVVIAFVINGFYWNAHGSNAADTRWAAKIQKERADAEQAARAKESMWQGVVNETAKNYGVKVAGVQRNLDAALGELRNRPERPSGVPEGARADCAGASGAELSRSDAEFLDREAARADTQRAGLVACYEVIDALK